MKCSKYPEKEAAGICTYSGKPFCSEELVEIEGKLYGKDYVSKVFEESKKEATNFNYEDYKTSKWYDNKAVVGILIFAFFPVGLYALWRSNTISKGWKVGWSLIVFMVLIFAFGSDPEEIATSTTSTDKLDISYSQVMEELSDIFKMEDASPVNGKNRYMGLSSNGIANLEIIGDKENISKTTLSIGLPSDNIDALIENSALLQRFIKNIDPNWEGSTRWMTSTLTKLVETPSSNEETIENGRKYSMTLYESLGILLLTVEPI